MATSCQAMSDRVLRGKAERISIPPFFNQSYDVNVAPLGSGKTMQAGEHVTTLFNETYLHLKDS